MWGDFQTAATGQSAVFPTTIPLTGFENVGNYELFHFDADGGEIACVSCNPTEVSPEGSSVLPANGRGISDDGRVFFNSKEPLVLGDTNERNDAYEWSEGRLQLISSGQSAFDSGLLSISSDGTNAFFFTRETLVSGDSNGKAMKLYTAREDGGLFVVPPPPPCKASDECHGAGSQAAPPPSLGTLAGTGGNVGTQETHCNRKKLNHRTQKLRRKAASYCVRLMTHLGSGLRS